MIAQQLDLLVRRREQVEAAADLRRGERRPHLFDLLGELHAVGVARLVVLELGERRPILRDLRIVRAHLLVILRFALRKQRLLHLAVTRGRGVGLRRRRVCPSRQLGFGAGDLRVVIRDLQPQRIGIGGGEGGIERRQHVPGLDPIADADIDGLDQRGVERLQHLGRLRADDFAPDALDDAVEPGNRRQYDESDDERRRYERGRADPGSARAPRGSPPSPIETGGRPCRAPRHSAALGRSGMISFDTALGVRWRCCRCHRPA